MNHGKRKSSLIKKLKTLGYFDGYPGFMEIFYNHSEAELKFIIDDVLAYKKAGLKLKIGDKNYEWIQRQEKAN